MRRGCIPILGQALPQRFRYRRPRLPVKHDRLACAGDVFLFGLFVGYTPMHRGRLVATSRLRYTEWNAEGTDMNKTPNDNPHDDGMRAS
jgi:hypothetical protein